MSSTRWLLGWIGLAVVLANPTGAMAAEPLGVDTDGEFHYLAVLPGSCTGYVVAGRTVPACSGKLVNVDFGNGRVAFLFTGRVGTTDVVTTFSGGDSQQDGTRTYELVVDRLTTTTVDAGARPVTVVASAAGRCTMTGDPTREATRFACRVRHAGQDTTVRFATTGTPTVYAGDADGAVPERREAGRPPVDTGRPPASTVAPPPC